MDVVGVVGVVGVLLFLFLINIINEINNKIIFPTEHYIVKYLLPHLDELSLNEIKLLQDAQKIVDGTLYDQFKIIRIPKLFIDLFSQL